MPVAGKNSNDTRIVDSHSVCKRACSGALKVSRTIADLAGSEEIQAGYSV